MSLPGNRLPAESVPSGSSRPAADADVLPVYCRHGIRWTWVPEEGGFICDDPEHYDAETPTTAGAIPVEHQPHFAHPPNEGQLIALRAEDIMAEREAVLDHIESLRRGL
jgi:hypothetical protein